MKEVPAQIIGWVDRTGQLGGRTSSARCGSRQELCPVPDYAQFIVGSGVTAVESGSRRSPAAHSSEGHELIGRSVVRTLYACRCEPLKGTPLHGEVRFYIHVSV